MKQVFHKTMSLVLTFVVLFSTLSFTVNMHYCGETLVETAVFQKAKGCGMEMESPSTKSCEITKKNCCDDKQLTIEGQDELHVLIDKISFEQQVFVASFFYSYITLFEGFDTSVVSYEDYKAPLVIRQLYKIDETYLI
jgi:hypothetical protein